MKLNKEVVDVFQFEVFEDGEQIDFVVFDRNTIHPPHVHQKVSSKLYVIEGNGKITLGSEDCEYKRGDIFIVPKGTRHGFKVIETTVLLSIQDGPILYGDKLDFKYD